MNHNPLIPVAFSVSRTTRWVAFLPTMAASILRNDIAVLRVVALACLLMTVVFNSMGRADYLVSDNFGNQVLRYSESPDGTFLGAFISNDPQSNGGLDGAVGMLFNTNGEFLVASQNTNQVLRYNGTTGAFLGVFASTDLNGPSHLAFHPTTGNLLVSNFSGNTVTQFDAAGNSLGSFTSGDPGLQGVTSFTFDAAGNFFAGSFNSGQIFQYDNNGNFVSEFATGLMGASGLRFDGDDLWVASLLTSEMSLLRPDGSVAINFSTGTPGTLGPGTFPSFSLDSPFADNEILVALAGEAGVYRFATNVGPNPARISFIGGFDPNTGAPLSVSVPGEILRVASIPEPVCVIPLMLVVGFVSCFRRR